MAMKPIEMIDFFEESFTATEKLLSMEFLFMKI